MHKNCVVEWRCGGGFNVDSGGEKHNNNKTEDDYISLCWELSEHPGDKQKTGVVYREGSGDWNRPFVILNQDE